MIIEEAIERLKLILETDIMTLNGLNTPHEPLEKEIEALKIAIKTLEVMNKACNSDDLVLIHTQGLDEGIRCAMCTNAVKSDRGCDGNCVVNNAMYKKVMDVIENQIAGTDKMIEPTPVRIKGHWIEEFNDIEGEVRFTCSSCGKYQLFGTDFCYNCGSDNRSEE